MSGYRDWRELDPVHLADRDPERDTPEKCWEEFKEIVLEAHASAIADQRKTA